MVTVVDEPAEPGGSVRSRRRLLDGLAAAITERGYRAATVTDIVRHARTSKRTFYGVFADKQECFIELLRVTNGDTVTQIRAAIDPQAPWPTQIRQGVAGYVDRLEVMPAIALSWIRDLPALGPLGQSVQRQTLDQLTEMMIEITEGPGFAQAGVPPITRPLATLLVGGIRELAALMLEDGGDRHDLVDTVVTGAIALLDAPSGRP